MEQEATLCPDWDGLQANWIWPLCLCLFQMRVPHHCFHLYWWYYHCFKITFSNWQVCSTTLPTLQMLWTWFNSFPTWCFSWKGPLAHSSYVTSTPIHSGPSGKVWYERLQTSPNSIASQTCSITFHVSKHTERKRPHDWSSLSQCGWFTPISCHYDQTWNPGPEHWKALKHHLCYIKGTADHKLTYQGNLEIFLTYTNAFLGDCVDTGCSTAGFVTMMAEGAVGWYS